MCCTHFGLQSGEAAFSDIIYRDSVAGRQPLSGVAARVIAMQLVQPAAYAAAGLEFNPGQAAFSDKTYRDSVAGRQLLPGVAARVVAVQLVQPPARAAAAKHVEAAAGRRGDVEAARLRHLACRFDPRPCPCKKSQSDARLRSASKCNKRQKYEERRPPPCSPARCSQPQPRYPPTKALARVPSCSVHDNTAVCEECPSTHPMLYPGDVKALSAGVFRCQPFIVSDSVNQH